MQPERQQNQTLMEMTSALIKMCYAMAAIDSRSLPLARASVVDVLASVQSIAEALSMAEQGNLTTVEKTVKEKEMAKNSKVIKKPSSKTPQNNQGSRPSPKGGSNSGGGNGNRGRFKNNGSSH